MFDKDSFILLGEKYKQRITKKEWSKILLNHEEVVIHAGRTRKLNVKPMGYGVVEVYMEPEKRS